MKTTLKEALYGNLATVYHRSKEADKSIKVYTGKARNGVAIFGGGLYTTYDIESQLTPRMIKNYGEYLYKMAVKIDGFFIFDKKLRDASMSKLYTTTQKQAIKDIEALVQNDDEFSAWDGSVDQVYVINKYKEVEDIIRDKFHGMIYNSKDDGKCLLAFNPKDIFIKILGFAKVESASVDKSSISWQKLK